MRTASSAIELRAYHDGDLAAVAALFTASIHGLAVAAYSAEQRAAWAPEPPDLAQWRARLHGQRTLLAVDGTVIAGFLTHSDDGHIDLLYTAPGHARRGVASALYQRAETTLRQQGVSVLVTEASLIAAPFFAAQGFDTVEEQNVERGGLWFRRFLMRKSLAPDSGTAGSRTPA